VYEGHLALLLRATLPGQLLNDDRIRRARELAHFIRREIIERMRGDEQRQVLELQVLRGEPPVCDKRGGDYR